MEPQMIIKAKNCELEVDKNKEVYVGSTASGQIFRDWKDLDKDVRTQLEAIELQAVNLIQQSERIIAAVRN